MATAAYQNGGLPAGTANGTPADSQDATQPAAGTPTQAAQQPPPPPPAAQPPPPQQQAYAQPHAVPFAADAAQPAPKPRDARTMELLLTAQGVTAYEARVPQLLLDFAYRHTSAVLSDALHLSADPYTSQAAGPRPSGASGAVATAPGSGDAAVVSANAVRLALASRLAFQFRGGGGGTGGAATGGGASKEWLLELARERNRVALPRVGAIEWGTRLPSERFVLSGVGWGLRDAWAPGAAAGGDGSDDGSDEDDDDDAAYDEARKKSGADGGDIAMGGTTPEDVGGDGVEGGTMGDVFEDDGIMEDEEMAME